MGSQDGALLASNSARHPSQTPALTMSAHGATIEPAKVFEVLAAMPPGVLFASAKESRKDPYRDGNYPGVTSGILMERPPAGPKSSRTGSPTTAGDRHGDGGVGPFRSAPDRGGAGESFKSFWAARPEVHTRASAARVHRSNRLGSPAGLRRRSDEGYIHARRAARVHRWNVHGPVRRGRDFENFARSSRRSNKQITGLSISGEPLKAPQTGGSSDPFKDKESPAGLAVIVVPFRVRWLAGSGLLAP
jgi:hypothetical protein